MVAAVAVPTVVVAVVVFTAVAAVVATSAVVVVADTIALPAEAAPIPAAALAVALPPGARITAAAAVRLRLAVGRTLEIAAPLETGRVELRRPGQTASGIHSPAQADAPAQQPDGAVPAIPRRLRIHSATVGRTEAQRAAVRTLGRQPVRTRPA
jgi:hypothetical protein